jgi:hypothetical protein
MLTDTIVCGIASIDKTLFSQTGPCPHCGGAAAPYDTKKKIYATLHTQDGKKKITVLVRRYHCRDCGKLLYAEEPFYPDTRIGSAIVDLATALSLVNSFSHTTEIINAMGIDIDRGTVRKYAHSNLPIPKINFFYGLPLPFSLFTIIGRTMSRKLSAAEGTEILAASGFPSAYRAPQDGTGTSHSIQKQREKRGNQKAAVNGKQ